MSVNSWVDMLSVCVCARQAYMATEGGWHLAVWHAMVQQ
jgi:hypothetical protein